MDFVKGVLSSAKNRMGRTGGSETKARRAEQERFEAESLELLGDDAEGQQMQMLWDSYEEVLSEDNGPEKAQPLLSRFEQAFEEAFSLWYPELSVGLGHGAYTHIPWDKKSSIVHQPRKMPPRIVKRVARTFAAEWQVTARYLLSISGADGRAGTPPSDGTDAVNIPDPPAETATLRILEILTRSAANRVLVREHGGLAAVFRLGHTAVRSLAFVCKALTAHGASKGKGGGTTTTSSSTTTASTAGPSARLVAVTERLVSLILQLVGIVNNFIDSQHLWLQTKNDTEEVRIPPSSPLGASSMSSNASGINQGRRGGPYDSRGAGSAAGADGGRASPGLPTSGDRGSAGSLPHGSSNAPPVVGISDLGASMETDAFCLLADILRAQQQCAWTFALLPCQYQLQLTCLDCVGAALTKIQGAQSKLRKAGLVDTIAYMFGWPQALSRCIVGDSGLNAGDVLKDEDVCNVSFNEQYLTDLDDRSRETVHWEYRTQLLCLHLLRDLIFQNRESSRRFHELNGFEKVIDTVLWITTFYRHQCQKGSDSNCLSPDVCRPSQPVYDRKSSLAPRGRSAVGSTTEADMRPPPALANKSEAADTVVVSSPSTRKSVAMSMTARAVIKPRQPTCHWPESVKDAVDLEALYNVLFALVMCGPGHNQGGGPSAADITPIHRDVLFALAAILDPETRPTLANAVTRRFWRTHSCELQLRVLDVFVSLIATEPRTLSLLRESCLFDDLASDDYFLRKFDVMGSALDAQVWSGYNPPSEFQACGGPECLSWLKSDTCDELVQVSGLRHYVMAFLQYTSAVAGMNNVSECKLLLTLMEKYSSSDEVVCMCANTISNTLTHARVQTQTSLLDLDALGTFAGLIAADRTRLEDEDEGPKMRAMSMDVPVYSPVSSVARLTILNMMTVLFDSKNVVHMAMGDIRLINQIFPLLFQDDMKEVVFELIKRLMQEGIGSTDTNSAISQQMLFTTYMEMFMALKSEPKEKQAALTLDLLHGIRDIVSTVPDRSLTVEKQRQFNEAGCFLWILTLLNVEEEEGLLDLCVAVLQTLTALMSGHEANKEFFAKNIGYDLLKKLILRAGQGQPEEDLFDLLFDLVAGDHFDMETNNTFRNPQAVALLFDLIPHAAPPLQKELFDKLTELLQKCTRNLAVCCSVNLLSATLAMVDPAGDEELLDKQVTFASVLGTHSVTVSELKQFFSLLKSSSDDFRPRHSRLFLKALRTMTKKHGSNVFFDLDGRRSGLQLPTIDKWPSYRGYSFSAWIRVESFQDPLGRAKYEPRLYSFLTSAGDGVEAFFSGTSLVLQTSRRGKNFSAVLDYRFSPHVWYHVVVVHAVKKTAFSQSWLKLFVNGELQKTVALKYPHVSEPLCHNRIGTNAAVTFNLAHSDSPDHRNAMPVFTNPLFGQLGALYIFEDALTAQQVQWIYNLGCDYMYMFQLTDAGASRGGNPAAFDGTLTSKVFASYNAKVQEGTLFLDNTPETSERLFGLHARCMPGTMACVTRNVSDIIHCLGGIKALLPLLPQLDQPVAPRAADGSSLTEISPQDIDYSIDSSLGALVLSLLAEMLRGSPSNISDLQSGMALKIINMQLRQISPQHMVPELFPAIGDLLTVLRDNDALVREVRSNLLYDFSLWIYTPYIVQEHLTRFLRTNIKKDCSYFRKNFGVQCLLDIIRTYYWTTPEPDSLCEKPFLHPVTQEVLGQRPSGEEIAIIRRNLLDLIEIMVAEGNGITSDEMTAMIYFIQDCRDSLVLRQVLQTLFDLLFRQAAQMVELISNLGGLDLFITLLTRDDELVRVLALRIIAKLLSSSTAFLAGKKNKIRLDEPHSQVAITRALECFPLSMLTYHALFAVLRCYVTDDARDAIHPSRDTYSFRNPAILSTILQVALAGSINLRITVLKDLLHQVTVSQENRRNFLAQTGWQHWLFDFMANSTPDEPEEEEGGEGELDDSVEGGGETSDTLPPLHKSSTMSSTSKLSALEKHHVINDTVLAICTVVLFHALQEDKGGWECVEFTMSLIGTYGARGVLHAHDTTRDLMHRILVKLKADAHRVPSDKTGPGMDNVVHFALLIENFLFYPEAAISPVTSAPDLTDDGFADGDLSMGPRLDAEGKWADRTLADMLVEVLAHWQLTRVLDFALLNVPLSSRTHIRPGGFLRLALRLVLHTLQQIDLDLSAPSFYCQFILTAKPFKEGSPQVLYVLSYLFKALAKTSDTDPAQETLGKLCKLVLRTHRPYLATILLDKNLKSLLATEPAWLREAAAVSEFAKETRTEVWQEAIREHIFGAANRVTEEELSYEPNIAARRETVIARVRQQQAVLAQGELQEERVRQQERQELVQRHTYAEVNRRSALAAERDHEDRRTRRQWRGLLRSLTNERGLWGTATDTGPVYWKLDKTEDYRRQRRKLKRDYNDRSYHGAADRKQREEQARAAAAAAAAAANGSGGDGAGAGPAGTDSGAGGGTGAPGTPASVQEVDAGYSGEKDAATALLSGIKLTAEPQEQADTEDSTSEADWDFAKLDGDETGASATLPEEKTVYSCIAEHVTVKAVTLGKFELTTTHIYFSAQYCSEESTLDFPPDMRPPIGPEQEELLKDRKWPLSRLRELHLRRYLLRQRGIEIFLTDHTNFFLNFKKQDRNKVYKAIVRLRPPNLVTYRAPGSSDILKSSSITSKWQRGAISNFDYLMLLNTLAGRTYNDLTQYPVFPWILQDYTSETINLDDPGVYRDLSKPVGALSKEPEELMERYEESFIDEFTPKFHYGSHYSSAGIVLYYGIRLEPFSQLAWQLQSGKFDHADRLFDSIPGTWRNVLRNSTDVKELIPEFFYLPEIFQNVNRLDMGVKQGGAPLDDVCLPAWAKSPEEFVRINRQALESPHVSAHLHEWIDLIFGHKQRGSAAVDACNVFFYLTYEGYDVDSIEDPHERKAKMSQIFNFGQTPSQLFTKPHPRRTVITNPESPFKQPKSITAFFIQHATSIVDESVLYAQIRNDRIITLGADRDICIHRWSPSAPNDGLPFTFELDRSLYTEWDRQELLEKKTASRGIRPERAQLRSGSRSVRRLSAPFDSSVHLDISFFHISRDGKRLYTSGHWDNSWKIVAVDTARVIQSVCQHKDIVTSLAVSKDGRTAVTGSMDTTVMVWAIDPSEKSAPVTPRPVHILNGHDGEVTCVAVNTEFDMVLSAARDGSCLVHTLRTGRLVRQLHPGATLASRPLCIDRNCRHPALSFVTISPMGRLLTYSLEDLFLRLYSINGTELASVDTYERLHAFKITADGDYLVTGGEKREVTLRSMFDLSVLHRYTKESEKPERAISCVDVIDYGNGEANLLVGSEDGKLLFFAVHKDE